MKKIIPLLLTCAFSDCLEEERFLVEDFKEQIFFGRGGSTSESEDSRPDISNLPKNKAISKYYQKKKKNFVTVFIILEQ